MLDWLKKVALFIFNLLKTTPPVPEPPPVEPPKPPEPPEPPEPPKPPEEPKDDLPPDNNFVWKPISDNDKMLAIVTPADYNFKTVTIHFGLLQQKTETGRTNGVRANGQRLAYRFTKPGKAYGKKIKVVGREEDGLERIWNIPNGAIRFEQRGGK